MKYTQLLFKLQPGSRLPCHAPEIYNINSKPCLDLLDSPSQRSSKCSHLLHQSWQQQQQQQWLWTGLFLVETQWPDWTWGIGCTSSVNPDTNQRQWDQFLGHHCPKCAFAHRLRGEINSCSFHLFFTHFTDCSYLRLTVPPPHPPLCFYLSLTNIHKRTHTHLSTHFPGRRESVYSFGRGQLYTWWQPRMAVLAQVSVCGGKRAREGRSGWMDPQACPSGSAQPAHSS